jgi:hypothetical protein
MAKLKDKAFETRWYHYLLVKFYWAIILLFAVILSIFAYNYIIQPIQKIKSKGGVLDVNYYQKILSEESAYYQNLKDLSDQVGRIRQEDLDKLEQVIADDSNLPAVLNQVNLLVEQNQSLLDNFGVSSADGVTTINLSLGNSSYESFKNFLYGVENNIQIMDVTDLNLAPDQKSFTVVVKTYYQQN